MDNSILIVRNEKEHTTYQREKASKYKKVKLKIEEAITIYIRCLLSASTERIKKGSGERKREKRNKSYRCCILTSDPAKHAVSKTAEVHIPLAWANLTDNMGQGKIPWHSHRLMQSDL